MQAWLLEADVQLSMPEGEGLLCSSAVAEQQRFPFKVTLPQAVLDNGKLVERY